MLVLLVGGTDADTSFHSWAGLRQEDSTILLAPDTFAGKRPVLIFSRNDDDPGTKNQNIAKTDIYSITHY
ncbi:MAG TPA: hypothetical protein HA272_10165 [Methanoregula sp.]|nr:hypothetical protein [Methanoregula sp.]